MTLQAERASTKLASKLVSSDSVAAGIGQVASSLRNSVVNISAAFVLISAQFASFTAAFLFYSFTVGFVRTQLGEPLVLTSDDEHTSEATSTNAPTGSVNVVRTTLRIGVAGSVAAIGYSLLIGVLGVKTLLIGLAMPVLVLHEVLRFMARAVLKSRSAVTSDVLWMVFAVSGAGLAMLVQGLEFLVGGWVIGGLVACAFLWNKVGQGEGRHLSLSLNQRDLWSLGFEFVGRRGGVFVALLLLGAIFGEDALANLRSIQTLASPYNLLVLAVPIVLFPMVSATGLAKPAWIMTAVALAGAAVTTAVFALVAYPFANGSSALGQLSSVGGVVVLLLMRMFIIGIVSVRLGELKRSGLFVEAARSHLISGPATVILALLGYQFQGLTGAFAGLLLAAIVWAVSLEAQVWRKRSVT